MKTQLYEWHAKNGDIIDFAGFKMPVVYSSIKEEHMAVRDAAGLFDVSHMGRMWIEGDDTEKFLNLLVPRDLKKTPVGKASYTFILNEQGGFRDDLVFERVEMNRWMLVWNAGNLKKIEMWLDSFKTVLQQFSALDIRLENVSSCSAMFALQGPKAKDILAKAFQAYVEPPLVWHVLCTTFNDIELIISGTGYTGEAGFEIIVLDTTLENPSKAEKIWELLIETGKPEGLKPCGLGARDSLRLEAGLSLYGNDIDEKINPIEANLFFSPFVHMDKEYFIGKPALEYFSDHKPNRVRVGFKALKKGPIPRPGVKLFKDGKEVGFVSSGGFSPLLNIGIGMGYVSTDMKKVDTSIQFEIRGRFYEAKIVNLPFFDPNKYGGKRK